ncbi:MAG TPA: hypothetical protein VK086_00260 [Ruania sp.]|nr:hypothetical protein [Ruania sp.]
MATRTEFGGRIGGGPGTSPPRRCARRQYEIDNSRILVGEGHYRERRLYLVPNAKSDHAAIGECTRFAHNPIFKFAQLDEPVTLGHWRTSDGVEVDLVIEYDDGTVLAFEANGTGRDRHTSGHTVHIVRMVRS